MRPGRNARALCVIAASTLAQSGSAWGTQTIDALSESRVKYSYTCDRVNHATVTFEVDGMDTTDTQGPQISNVILDGQPAQASIVAALQAGLDSIGYLESVSGGCFTDGSVSLMFEGSEAITGGDVKIERTFAINKGGVSYSSVWRSRIEETPLDTPSP